MTTSARTVVTPAQYLEAERRSAERHEYVNGQIYAMVGASRAHNCITLDAAAELRARLRGGPCQAFVSDMRVKVAATGMYTYPDVVVVCGEPQFEDAEVDTLLNPRVIIEVLSPSTERYDRGDKFAHYRQLPSLAEYVLVAQHRPAVDRFVRQETEGLWLLETVTGLDATVSLAAIGCTLALRDIFERVEFDDPEARGPALG